MVKSERLFDIRATDRVKERKAIERKNREGDTMKERIYIYIYIYMQREREREREGERETDRQIDTGKRIVGDIKRQ